MREDLVPGLSWRQLHWQRPVDPLRVLGCLRQWAADQRSPRLVLEARGSHGAVSYLLGASPAALKPVIVPLRFPR